MKKGTIGKKELLAHAREQWQTGQREMLATVKIEAEKHASAFKLLSKLKHR